MKFKLLLSLFIINLNLCYAQIGRDTCKSNNDCSDNYYCKKINSKGCLDCEQNCNIYGYCNCPCYFCTGEGL